MEEKKDNHVRGLILFLSSRSRGGWREEVEGRRVEPKPQRADRRGGEVQCRLGAEVAVGAGALAQSATGLPCRKI
eukprot:3068290-Rhodomonas_salina.1